MKVVQAFRLVTDDRIMLVKVRYRAKTYRFGSRSSLKLIHFSTKWYKTLSTVALHSKSRCFAFFRTLRQNVVCSCFATPSTIRLRTCADDSLKSIDLNSALCSSSKGRQPLSRVSTSVDLPILQLFDNVHFLLTEPRSATIIFTIKARARLCNLG